MNFKSALGNAFDNYRSAGKVPLTANMKLASRQMLENREIVNFANSQSLMDSNSSELIQPQYSIQRLFRPLYGKADIQTADIGDHPDYRYLAETGEQVYAPITTLFMDIAGSTRLGRILPLPEVMRIKNAFMSATIEIAQAFDGHVHRLMGDAVMVYFGGTHCSPEQGAVDALNCASAIRYFVDKIVTPRLKNEGFDDPVGIRIGLDYGKKDDVLWACYGYPGTCEVTATSYYVDVAAKLQHSAGKNQIMIGDSLRSFLDLPNELTGVKYIKNGTVEQPDYYVSPNYTDENGKPFNYKKFMWDWDKYLQYSPIAQTDEDLVSGCTTSGIMRVTADICETRTDVGENYNPTSLILNKRKHIRFRIKLPYMPKLPYTLRFIVENNGQEAKNAGGISNGNHETKIDVRTLQQHENIVHWEETAYRGLHYMIIKLSTAAGLTHETRFGVFIE